MRSVIVLGSILQMVRCQDFITSCWGEDDSREDIESVNHTCTKLGPRNYKLTRIDPVKVGHRQLVDLVPGRKHTRITRATLPPLFEVADFLTDKECDYLICMARSHGLRAATMVGKGGDYQKETGKVGTRKGMMTFLRTDNDPYIRNIQKRVAKLADIPMELLEESELFQVGHYDVGGHYHSHYDSTNTTASQLMSSPCCHTIDHPHSYNRCIICRYITVLFYLNDVEEGGETAFPVADSPGAHITNFHINLSDNCHSSPVVIKPKRGKLIMWYNNYRDEETGWIGTYDPFALHGGCLVHKGEKWIGSVMISVGQHHRRHANSIYANRWT